METYRIEEESIHQQCEIGERIVENMDEVKEQIKDNFPGNFELVSLGLVYSASATFRACRAYETIANT
jgi:hypothetical protein